MPRMPNSKNWITLKEHAMEVLSKDGKNVDQVYVSPVADQDFVWPIGHLLLCWSVYEKYIVNLIAALLTATGVEKQNWYGLPFTKKFELMRDSWLSFCEQQPNLRKLPSDLAAQTAYAKTLREHLTHNILECGMFVPGEKFIRFQISKPPGQYTQRYTLEDFTRASTDLQKAAGQIYHLRMYPDSLPLTQQEKQLLRTLPDMGFQRPPSGA